MSAAGPPKLPPRVVILGGGFGGLACARALKRAPAEVVVVDRTNHHLFQPLLYEVATAALSAPDIAVPIRKILRRQTNARVVLGEARAVDAAGRRVLLADGEIAYDYLVIATGVATSYFGHPEWEEHAPGLKTLEDAARIRERILLAYEDAEREPDPARRARLLTFVVIGGGPTGVEVAGALADLSYRTLARDFRGFDPREARILLLEGGPAILPAFPAVLQRKAVAQLERLGVQVRTGAMVGRVDAGGVEAGGERIASRTVIWAAGVRAPELAASLGAERDGLGRIPVAPDLTLPGQPAVFVVGDLARLDQDGRPLPALAPAAMQMGRHAARSIRRALGGLNPEPFRYRDRGALATIGRHAAVAELGRLRLSGFPAWLAWMAVHIFFLIGFANRVLVMFQWAWLYLTYQRSSRVILRTTRAGDPPTQTGRAPGSARPDPSKETGPPAA